LTRLHARYAQLLGEGGWLLLDRVGQFAAFVERARDTSLRPWVANFDPHVSAHRIESTLRDLFSQRVLEIAHWMPTSQRAAIAWIGQAPVLPMTRHRSADERPYDWLPVVAAPPLLSGEMDGRALVQRWLNRWRELWGVPRRDELDGLERIVAIWQESARMLRDRSHPIVEIAVRRLGRQLRRDFRSRSGALPPACAYIGLLWLQTARLRGALVRRRLFATPLGPAA
jgi:hypothetical protein